VDIIALHEAILAHFRTQFPDLQTVADYRELTDDHEELAIPAVLVELTDLEAAPDDDDGTGRLPMVAIFEASIIMGFRTESVGRAVRDFSASLATYVHQQRWGLTDVQPAFVVSAGVHEFSPATPRYHAWRVEWRQIVHLGNTVWTNDGTVPQAVYSWVPEIGPGNEDRYQPVAEEQP
jgi:hypothetical protein